MFRITKAADYGVQIAAHLACAEKAFLNAQEVARALRLPLPMAARILKILAQAGLLQATRGPNGGYALARAAKDISIYEVISALEGPPSLTECLEVKGACVREGDCGAEAFWRVLDKMVCQALAGVSIEHMAQLLLEDTGQENTSGTVWEDNT